MPEYLSALLDGEAGEFEQRRVLDELKSSDSLCNKLSTYALIGEAMRSSSSMDTPVLNRDSNFLVNIHARIEEEEQYNEVQLKRADNTQTQATHSPSWLKPMGGFALAASVAAVAVLGFQNFQQSGLLSESMVAANGSNSKAMIAQRDHLSESEMVAATRVPASTLVSTAPEKIGADDVSAKNATRGGTQEYVQADTQTRSLLKRYVDSHMQYASTAVFVPSVRVIAYTDNQ